jgi:hypothetical protein
MSPFFCKPLSKTETCAAPQSACADARSNRKAAKNVSAIRLKPGAADPLTHASSSMSRFVFCRLCNGIGAWRRRRKKWLEMKGVCSRQRINVQPRVHADA